MLDHELSELRLILERQGGILLDAPQDVIISRLNQYLEKRRLKSVAEGIAASGRDIPMVRAGDLSLEDVAGRVITPILA